ncbi:MAG: heavy metal translocating P-type ATPase, partial [Gammaproteobacteria bacterium]|nr:heavy metal translocating P-type ATPase [Gammaproteobacteria bacterium]
MQEINLSVSGMTGIESSQRIERAITVLDGVERASVNLSEGMAKVSFRNPASAGSVIKAVRDEGYTTGNSKIRISVKKMRCASCVRTVEETLLNTPGVKSASINLATAIANVEYSPEIVNFLGLKLALEANGYDVELATDSSKSGQDAQASEQEIEYRTLMRKFWFAAIISIPVMVFSYPDFIPGLRDWMPMGSMNRRVIWGLLGLLALPVMLWSGSQFYSGMWSALKHRTANMHTLIASGITAAWLYSAVAVLFPQWFPEQALAEAFWDVATVVVALVVLGMALEVKAKGRTSEAIKK